MILAAAALVTAGLGVGTRLVREVAPGVAGARTERHLRAAAAALLTGVALAVLQVASQAAPSLLVPAGATVSVWMPLALVARSPRHPAVARHDASRADTPQRSALGLPPACRLVKRALDLALGSVCLVLATPVMAVAALAIRLDSPGPVLFLQDRVGKDGRTFRVAKLRTMHVGVDGRAHQAYVAATIAGSAPRHHGLYKLTADPRCTRVGRILRRTSLDELPQLWNVLRGEMSLVGPRPSLPEEVADYPAEALDRLAVLPGITGLWQVSGRSRLPFDRMVELDIEYWRSWSLRRELRILVRTPVVALWDRETA